MELLLRAKHWALIMTILFSQNKSWDSKKSFIVGTPDNIGYYTNITVHCKSSLVLFIIFIDWMLSLELSRN